MNKKEAWKKFVNSGKVEDYLDKYMKKVALNKDYLEYKKIEKDER